MTTEVTPDRGHSKAKGPVVEKYTGQVQELMPSLSVSLFFSGLLCFHVGPSLFLHLLGEKKRAVESGDYVAWDKLS